MVKACSESTRFGPIALLGSHLFHFQHSALTDSPFQPNQSWAQPNQPWHHNVHPSYHSGAKFSPMGPISASPSLPKPAPSTDRGSFPHHPLCVFASAHHHACASALRNIPFSDAVIHHRGPSSFARFHPGEGFRVISSAGMPAGGPVSSATTLLSAAVIVV